MSTEFDEAIAAMIYDGWTDAEIMEKVAAIRAELEEQIQIQLPDAETKE